MRRVTDLSYVELAAIVAALQQSLYLDFVTDPVALEPQKIWNPAKAWDGADICDQLAATLAEFELVPASVVSFE